MELELRTLGYEPGGALELSATSCEPRVLGHGRHFRHLELVAVLDRLRHITYLNLVTVTSNWY